VWSGGGVPEAQRRACGIRRRQVSRVLCTADPRVRCGAGWREGGAWGQLLCSDFCAWGGQGIRLHGSTTGRPLGLSRCSAAQLTSGSRAALFVGTLQQQLFLRLSCTAFLWTGLMPSAGCLGVPGWQRAPCSVPGSAVSVLGVVSVGRGSASKLACIAALKVHWIVRKSVVVQVAFGALALIGGVVLYKVWKGDSVEVRTALDCCKRKQYARVFYEVSCDHSLNGDSPLPGRRQGPQGRGQGRCARPEGAPWLRGTAAALLLWWDCRDLTACALWQQGQAKGAYKDAKHSL